MFIVLKILDKNLKHNISCYSVSVTKDISKYISEVHIPARYPNTIIFCQACVPPLLTSSRKYRRVYCPQPPKSIAVRPKHLKILPVLKQWNVPPSNQRFASKVLK